MMYGNLFHVTEKLPVLIFKALILISFTVPCHMLTPPESTLLYQIDIDSLSRFGCK